MSQKPQFRQRKKAHLLLLQIPLNLIYNLQEHILTDQSNTYLSYVLESKFQEAIISASEIEKNSCQQSFKLAPYSLGKLNKYYRVKLNFSTVSQKKSGIRQLQIQNPFSAICQHDFMMFSKHIVSLQEPKSFVCQPLRVELCFAISLTAMNGMM